MIISIYKKIQNAWSQELLDFNLIIGYFNKKKLAFTQKLDLVFTSISSIQFKIRENNNPPIPFAICIRVIHIMTYKNLSFTLVPNPHKIIQNRSKPNNQNCTK